MSQNFPPYYRRHLLQFGGVNLSVEEAANLTLVGTIRVLAWVVRYFVVHVSQKPKLFWTSMLAGTPLGQYMTHSDLALAVLILEHSLMKWRHLLQVEQETGEPPSKEYCKNARGLLYDDGIAGEEAKRRFDALSIYFYNNFYGSSPEATRSMSSLQNILNVAVRKDAALIQSYVDDSSDDCWIPEDRLGEVKDDILHRVFYYVFF